MSTPRARNGKDLLFIFALVTFLFSVSGMSTAEEQPPGTEGQPPRHDPFTLHPADVGAVDWGSMADAERANTNSVMEWAETRNGASVHDAFSAAAARTSAIRIVEDAQQASNLDGIETLGVVP